MELEECQRRVWDRVYASAAVGVDHGVTAAWYLALARRCRGCAARRLRQLHDEELRAARVLGLVEGPAGSGPGEALPRQLPAALRRCLEAEARRIPVYAAQVHAEPFGGVYELLCRQAKAHQFHLLSILGLLTR